MVGHVGREHLVDDDHADQHADHDAETEDEADRLLRGLEALVLLHGLVHRPHDAVVVGEGGGEAPHHLRRAAAGLQRHEDMVGGAGNALRKELEEGLVGDDQMTVRGETAADRNGAGHGEGAAL